MRATEKSSSTAATLIVLGLTACSMSGARSPHGADGSTPVLDASSTPDAPPRDAAAAPDSPSAVDAGLAACTFSTTDPATGVTLSCGIDGSSQGGCTDAAVCLCRAQGLTDDAALLQCVAWELTPRGAVTFADYCSESPPARTTMEEALTGYLGFSGTGETTISAGCATVPALMGPEPWEPCGPLASRVCRCVSADTCAFDAILGGRCLSMTRDQVRCLADQLPDTEDLVCGSLDEIPIWRERCTRES